MFNQKFALKLFEGFSIQRWTDLVRPFDLVEMDKAAEKMVLAYIIGKYEENEGHYVDWLWMIYASLFDLLSKISLCDIKAPVLDMLKREFSQEYFHLNEWVLKTYKPVLMDNEIFSRFTIYTGQKAGQIVVPEKSLLASKIFSAANKFATLRELQMLKTVNEAERLEQINTELQAQIQHYLDLKGMQNLVTHQRSYSLLLKIEQLRFQIRWNQTPRVPKTSVLGHCFFVAILTLLLCRDSGVKMTEKRIINNFFTGLFHDLPEAVTRDIISPVKQATDELPNIVKKIEDEIVRKELLPLMEPFFADELMYFTSNEFANRIINSSGNTEEVTWEDLNSKYNSAAFSPVDGRIVRIADHISALMEADISIKHGITSNHLKFGRKNMLENYPVGKIINGIDAGKLFHEIAENSEN